MAANLAPIYLDDTRIRLQGDPRPKVSKILEAGGKGQSGSNFQVIQLESQQDQNGKTLKPEDVIDRTAHGETAVYLKAIRKGEKGESEGMGKPGANYPGGQGKQEPLRGGQPGQPQETEGSGKSFQKGGQGQGSETATPGQGGDFGGTREAGKANQQGTQRTGGAPGQGYGGQPDKAGQTGGGKGQQEFGRHETDREQGEGDFGGQGRGRTASSEQKEWKPGVQGTGSTQGDRATSGGNVGKTDVRSQQTGSQGGAGEREAEEDDTRMSGGGPGKNRGNRPSRKGQEPEESSGAV